MATGTTPQFEVVFKGTALEPMADVAPEGDVDFVILNESDQPHEFALVRVGGEAGGRRSGWEGSTAPLGAADAGVIALAADVEAGAAGMLTQQLRRGRYALVSNTPGEWFGTSIFELTVQPVDGTQ